MVRSSFVNMVTGRPPVFESPEEMQKKIDEYFEYVKGEFTTSKTGVRKWTRDAEPVTITGLCIYLGFDSRQSFYDYEKNKDFSYTIKKARMKVENSYEQRLSSQNVAGSIFALKNMGWEDRQKSEISGGIDVNKKPSWFDDAAEEKTT